MLKYGAKAKQYSDGLWCVVSADEVYYWSTTAKEWRKDWDCGTTKTQEEAERDYNDQCTTPPPGYVDSEVREVVAAIVEERKPTQCCGFAADVLAAIAKLEARLAKPAQPEPQEPESFDEFTGPSETTPAPTPAPTKPNHNRWGCEYLRNLTKYAVFSACGGYILSLKDGKWLDSKKYYDGFDTKDKCESALANAPYPPPSYDETPRKASGGKDAPTVEQYEEAVRARDQYARSLRNITAVIAEQEQQAEQREEQLRQRIAVLEADLRAEREARDTFRRTTPRSNSMQAAADAVPATYRVGDSLAAWVRCLALAHENALKYQRTLETALAAKP